MDATGQFESWVQSIALQVLQLFLENSSNESVQGFYDFALRTPLPDGTNLDGWSADPAVLRYRMLLSFAQWTVEKAHTLDVHVPLQAGITSTSCANSLAQEIGGNAAPAVSEFIYHVAVHLLGPDAACFAKALGGYFAYRQTQGYCDTAALCKHPSLLISDMVKYLEDIQAKVLKVASELAVVEVPGTFLMQFCRHFTVTTTFQQQFWLQAHEKDDDAFTTSEFKIILIDSCGSLMIMLQNIENHIFESHRTQTPVLAAVDFEGVDLCRTGELCLLQMTCNNDPTLVYVLDVHLLREKAFSLATPGGTSMKSILEDDQGILKLWFDPRNDVDALYYQFGITPKNVFDLQLAEVAVRRSQAHNPRFVTGLGKCLRESEQLSADQIACAQDIDARAKALFEPKFGGRYVVFQERPLRDDILTYAAHDSRYMIMLYELYVGRLTQEWQHRVSVGSNERARWYQHTTYTKPTTDVPDF
mmetsp:Transcript_37766/g.70458  ORF Transcript_37766/g.70458 Transcript_37766/m.70458 type:complete len:474 (-) Transcript_37766:11-1432(-)